MDGRGHAPERHGRERGRPIEGTHAGQQAACSLGFLATSQQYFSLRTNQPPVTSQQYSK
jgi:hypothetical protein